MRSDGRGIDPLAALMLVFGVLAILTAVGILSIALAMMFAPMRADDPKNGAICMILTTLICGIPGIVGLVVGVARLARRRDQLAAMRTTSTRGSSM